MNSNISVDIINGNAKRIKGYRQVAFNSEGEILPVIAARWSGKPTDRHTRQTAYNGDFVLRYEWSPALWTLLQVREGELVTLADGLKTHRDILSRLPVELDDFLRSEERSCPSFLPAGLGWDGVNTQNSIKKMDKIRHLFKELSGVEFNFPAKGMLNWLDELCRQAAVTSHNLMEFKSSVWLNGGNLPGPVLSTQDSFYQWVVWYENGMAEIIPFMPTEAVCTPTAIPAGVKQIAVITWLAQNNDRGESYGVAWQLYDHGSSK